MVTTTDSSELTSKKTVYFMQKHTCQVEQTQIFGFAKILMEVLSSLASALHPDLCPHLHAACITILTPQEGSG